MNADNKIEFTASVDADGKITVPHRFDSDVARLFSGKEIVITVERKRKKRSQNQNAYYWAVIVAMITEAMNEAGENVTEDLVHEFLKFRFLRYQKIDPDSGEIVFEYGRSTTALKTFEFAIYIDQCIQFAAEYLQIVIPPPSTQIDRFSFPEYQGKEETREEYLQRIAEEVSNIYHRWQLRKYFNQVPAWIDDQEIRSIFNARRNQIN